jgi:hypothetical protein
MLFSVILLASAGVLLATPTKTFAAKCTSDFIILKPWYEGLTKNKDSSHDPKTERDKYREDCALMQPTADGDGKQSGGDISLSGFVWTIVLNILDDIFRVIGVFATGYLIWGGYRYMLARGRPEQISKAKLTILNAIIGLAIAALGGSIVNLFLRIMLG